MRHDVTLVTCQILPEPDPDEALLLAALTQAGLTARLAAWDDPGVDWSLSALTVLRSTWNYYHRPQDFLAWLAQAAQASRLYNPAPLVAWNLHKRYLLEMAEAGLPVVPTLLAPRHSPGGLAALASARDWSKVVIKPAISAGSHHTYVREAHEPGAQQLWQELVSEQDMLVQPWLAHLGQEPEVSLVHINGQLTHAVHKFPRFAGAEERTTGPHAPSTEACALAKRVWDFVQHGQLSQGERGQGERLLYGRLDLVRDLQGRLAVAELELAEPSLFFRYSPQALERFVEAITARLHHGQRG